MNLNIRAFAVIFISIIIFAAACGVESYKSSETALINKTADGRAIRGYDAVAYQTIEAATKGKPEYEYAWNGAKWLFVSKENRDRFAENPEIYAPEYGGFCAWSAANGNKTESDPEEWKIVDGKLYLIQSGQVKQVWEKSQADFIEKANENWQQMKKN